MNSNNEMITGQTNELRIKVQDAAVNAHKWMTCLNCIYWNKERQDCDKFHAAPPAHIIVSGCVDHEFDIPF